MKHMTRRRFLGAATAGLPLSSARTNAAIAPTRIIDTHTHFYDPTRPQGVPWPPRTEALLYRRTLPQDFQEVIQRLHVAGTIVVEASPWLEDNQWLLDLARENPLIVGVVGHLEPGSAVFKSHLQRFTKDPLFRGIRLSGEMIATGLSQTSFVADLQRIADAGLEIDAIGENSMLTDLVTLSDTVPHLRVVIDHLPFDPPSGGDAGHKAQSALRELGRRPLVYAKVSGVLRRIEGRVATEVNSYRPLLDQMWETFGSDRLLYGSNWPVSNLLAPYATVLKVVREYFLGKGAAASEKYFWKNSEVAYRWLDRR
jgi:L-fuconolactonase